MIKLLPKNGDSRIISKWIIWPRILEFNDLKMKAKVYLHTCYLVQEYSSYNNVWSTQRQFIKEENAIEYRNKNYPRSIYGT